MDFTKSAWMRLTLHLRIAIAAGLLLAGCGSSHKAGSNATTRPTGPSSSSEALVQGRASAPSEVTAPGLQIQTGSFEVDVNNQKVVIAARDWNTITSSSTVSGKVGVTIDPEFHASITTRNRFQYLADRLIAVAEPQFRPVGIVSAPDGKTIVAIDALLNPTNRAYRLSGLHVTVVASPPRTTVGTVTLDSGAEQSVVIPARDVDFLRVAIPVTKAFPKPVGHEVHEETNFHYDRLVPCGVSGCSS